MRQLTTSFVKDSFKEFERGSRLKNNCLVTFTEYDESLHVPVAWPTKKIIHPLAEVISNAHLKQLHIG